MLLDMAGQDLLQAVEPFVPAFVYLGRVGEQSRSA